MSTGFLDAKPRRPGAIVAVVAVYVAGIGGLMMIAPTVVQTFTKPLEGYNVPRSIVPPEPVSDPAPKTKAKTPLAVDRIERRVESKPAENGPAPTESTQPFEGTGSGDALGGGMAAIEIDPPVDPVIVAPRFVGRNAQPPYPPGMQRLNIEGAVTVRVLVGVDGRPLRIEAVKVDQEAFFAATRNWGMKYWKFAPATRDGAPFAEWRTMTVRFEMD